MRIQKPLAFLLSLLIAAQPAMVQAAGARHLSGLAQSDAGKAGKAAAGKKPDKKNSAQLRKEIRSLNPAGYKDKAAEKEIEDLVNSLAASLPTEAVDELAAIAGLLAVSNGDPAALEQARQRLADMLAALPEETRAQIDKLVATATSMAGTGYVLRALAKFQQHKDNPTQIPIGTPIALVFIAAALLFLPDILDPELDTTAASTGSCECAGAGVLAATPTQAVAVP